MHPNRRMHITKVELENIKSHAKAVFDFERGSTAITGENGAGKTTIIEAIAWTLFDTLDYKKDDFLRRGATKGWAEVTFVSTLDEREYVVYRDTATGYHVTDPSLGTRLAYKREEVRRFLCQHLGVEPGTDLEALFKQAIGVPQGTFTAVFLATAADRKKTFDTLLKVEEYRRGAEELLKTSRYVDGKIADANVKIARAEGEIARADAVKEEHSRLRAQAAELGKAADELDARAAEKSNVVRMLDETEAALSKFYLDLEKQRGEKSRADFILGQRESESKQSLDAAEKIAQVESDSKKHVESLGRLKDLERERDAREKLRIEGAKIESAITAVYADRKHLNQDLESIQKSHAVILELKTIVVDQDRLERDVARLRDDVIRLDSVCSRIASLDEQLGRLRDSYRANTDQLKTAREKGAAAGTLNDLEGRDAGLVRELAALQATLERDQRFQKEISNGLCPILSEKCLNIKPGQTLEMFVTSQFSEVKAKIALLEDEKVKVSNQLAASREAARFLAQISVLEARAVEIGDEGMRLKNERVGLEKEAENLPRIRTELERVETELRALDNPRSKIAILENQARRETDVREQLTKIEKNLERLESDRRINAEQLEMYKDFDAHWAESSALRDETTGAYRVFLANEALAKLVGEREKSLAESRKTLDEIAGRLTKAEAEYENASKGYDRERHLSERASLGDLQKRQAEMRATFDAANKREAELAAELERLEEIRGMMQNEFREKERLEKVAEATDFIRATLKEAAPLVARNYVYHVSVEANQMYREITGNAESSLKWAEDYGILLEEEGYERPFQSMSGGEQMAAALAVRLALLKQLSDIRIAFFDEPTTNMDAERRENLAMQISQIRHFDQLFVISHDDTFEGYMDHEIKVGE